MSGLVTPNAAAHFELAGEGRGGRGDSREVAREASSAAAHFHSVGGAWKDTRLLQRDLSGVGWDCVGRLMSSVLSRLRLRRRVPKACVWAVRPPSSSAFQLARWLARCRFCSLSLSWLPRSAAEGGQASPNFT